MCSTEAKGFVLVFLEGKDCLGGWGIVARKLRNLGVTLGSQVSRGALFLCGPVKRENLNKGLLWCVFCRQGEERFRSLGKGSVVSNGEKEVATRKVEKKQDVKAEEEEEEEGGDPHAIKGVREEV
ncbi:hypothetical protein CK203_013207 [Vitis vinifera]|uniref:Uncharacterized protein n=1 Tax=Vitis vinifera TaxID=29760 RepID=A0A438JQ20_VITVI|nr:hypothetical protein CK203_013207 [Vitis vinifera]